MNVVVLDSDVSYPATSGKRLRTLNLLLPLARRHNIVYLGRLIGDRGSDPEAEAFFRDHGIEPVFAHHPLPKKSGPMFYLRLAANIFDSKPYSVTSHLSPILRQAARRLAAERAIDLWQIEWPMLLSLIDRQPNVPRVVVAHNVESLIWQRYVETTTNPLKKAFLEIQRRKFEACELWSLRAADRVIAVSQEDAEWIGFNSAQPHVDVVDNGVDPAYYSQITRTSEPQTILFLGALDWRPNQDAIDLMLTRIFPDVRRRLPEAKLLIVGRNPPTSLSSRARSVPGVELHANVPDVRPYLARASVMAVPLRIGGGSRLKILEALASGLPVVSSSVGAEGLRLTPGQHYIAAEIDAMAGALVAALQHPESGFAMAECGQKFVREQYDWESLANKLEQSWEAARADAPRLVAAGSR